MKQFQVIYDRGKCIAAGLCESIDPDHFVLKDDKAELLGGRQKKKDIFVLELDKLDENHKRMLVEAAMSCPVNAISVKDLNSNKFLVSSEVKNIGKLVKASYNEAKEWKMDPKGYFLIRIDRKNRLIEAGHCTERNIIDMKIAGKNATEIFNTIIRENLVSSLQHAAYLGKELYKAELALKRKLDYVQDKEK